MKLIRDLYNIRPEHRGCAATIGNFDGVHKGHQRIITQLRAAGERLGVPTVAIVFEPQPREFFEGAAAPARLMRLREKVHWLLHYGVDRVLCIRFNDTLSALSPVAFVNTLLVEGLAVRALVIGDDFRFGRARAGDFSLLSGIASDRGFELIRADTVSLDGERISSTRVRALLGSGDLAGAARLLGRNYAISGRVIHGGPVSDGYGPPTISIGLHRHGSALSGIFAARVHGLAGAPLASLVRMAGTEDRVAAQALLQAHLFDFSPACHGAYVQVEFIEQMAGGCDVDAFARLCRQVEADAAAVRAVLQAG